MKFSILTFLFFSLTTVVAQTEISGVVINKRGIPIVGANVFLEGTYDGASTNDNGYFSFTTTEVGEQLFKVTYLSYEPYEQFMDVRFYTNLKITLKEDVNSLATVVLSAGTFEASDNSKVSVLKPLDVVTTASALGDFVGALQTLPGTTTVAEDGRLFVRGGDAGETQIFIDGIRVFTPYTATSNNVPARGRYSPFLFDGITFSTGGYSAEYGEALSSVLLLNTIDEPDQNKTDISIMSLGGGLGLTRKWNKSSLSLSTSYLNLAAYNAIFPVRDTWQKPFEVLSGEAVYRYRTANGLFKMYLAGDTTNFKTTQEDINNPEGFDFALKNRNLYLNTNYTEVLSDAWTLHTGGSYTLARNRISPQSTTIDNTQHSAHLKLKMKKRFSNQVKFAFGTEHFTTDFSEEFKGSIDGEAIHQAYNYLSNITAFFAESDIIFSRDFAIKLGARTQYTDYMGDFTFSPRASIAYKTGKNSQLSLAYGDFYQNPQSDFLKFSQEVTPQKTSHYIANYQYSNNGRIFRAEAYRKTYSNLITYNSEFIEPETTFSNVGAGYAQGIDFFWRDNTSIKNMDYWISYSYLDSERKYLNFPSKARPSFASPHNISVVTKYFIDDWKSQVGFSFQHSSGRTYTDKNQGGFLQSNTKSFNSLSVNWAYLLGPQKIIYASVQNVLGFRNINGYQYAESPSATGSFNRKALRPATDQFFFVGFFWTISDDKTSNQLDNL
ncbi:TonB-dependent receptor [Dokdonia sp. Hel_I_53]|uniref:TonB-dependent receptor n=1 Tax=Dokdonia sp. Hel_I_53 TaxID=1566287 RepID=UPI00119B90C6|nr:TonB-dependent receptor [Dokdonia sp. Hel_I_53]TVZ51553.1 outer membrane cobalamin receptor [Dokdonia sp. Hel_I_53]